MSDEPNEVRQEAEDGSVALANMDSPVVMTPDQFIEQARAQERLANEITLKRLSETTPAVAALIAERDALKARVAELEATSNGRKRKADA